MTADRISGVLLLDHTPRNDTSMIGCLRRLRGGITVLYWLVDMIRTLNGSACATGAPALCVRMPEYPNRRLRAVPDPLSVACHYLSKLVLKSFTPPMVASVAE